MMNNINLQIDAAARQVSQNGKAVYLTQTEFDLLLYLLDNAGRITTRFLITADDKATAIEACRRTLRAAGKKVSEE